MSSAEDVQTLTKYLSSRSSLSRANGHIIRDAAEKMLTLPAMFSTRIIATMIAAPVRDLTASRKFGETDKTSVYRTEGGF